MGAKAVVMIFIILGVVVGEIEGKSCCRNTLGRNCYNTCRFPGTPRPVCAKLCDCIIITGPRCPPSHPRGMLENSASVGDYCNLGCTSSVCNTIISGLNSGTGEGEMKEAVEHCKNACSELCNNVDHKVELPALAD